MTPSLLTLTEVASLLNVKYHRAATLAREGILPVIHLGRQVRVSPEALHLFISEGGKSLPGGWRRRAE